MLKVIKEGKAVALGKHVKLIGGDTYFKVIINNNETIYNCNSFSYYTDSLFVVASNNKSYIYDISKRKAKLLNILNNYNSYHTFTILDVTYLVYSSGKTKII